MTPERLAEVRAWLRGELDPMVDSPPSMGDEDWTDAVFAHVDAITLDRDEARSEVRALRAQRDEIREAHRVELAAVKAKLAALVEAHVALAAAIDAAGDAEDAIAALPEDVPDDDPQAVAADAAVLAAASALKAAQEKHRAALAAGSLGA